MSWAKLPVELQRAILEEVYEKHKDHGTTEIYARTCKQWHDFMHERRMISVVVGWDRVADFCKYIASTDDLLHMRRITLKIVSTGPATQYEFMIAMTTAASVYLFPLYMLLHTLATITRDNDKYASHPGIVLCLGLDGLSGSEHTYSPALLSIEHMAVPFGLVSNNIVRVCQVDQDLHRCIGNSSFQGALSSCHGLEILRLSMRRSHAFCSLPNRNRAENGTETAFGYLLQLGASSPCKSLIIYQTDFYDSTEHPKLGWLVAEAACSKEHVSISHVADASDILGNAAAAEKDGDLQKLHWPVLKTLVLSASILSEEHTPEQVQDFLVTVSKSVSRMPMLEKLELHHSEFNNVAIFRYTSHPPVLYIAATRPMQGILTPQVVELWENSTSRRLAVVEEQLPPNLSRVVAAYHGFAYPMALRQSVYARHRHSSLCKELSTRGSWYTRTPARHIMDEVADFEEVHYAKTLIIR